MSTSNISMNGKIVLVTGGTSGIGKATALALADQGATTVVVGRNREKTTATVVEIKSVTGNPQVEMLLADLSAQADVRRITHEFIERHDRLDVLVNNVGGGFTVRRESVDGIEMTWALNHLSSFLLTNLLLDSLATSSSARVINVTSSSHRGARIDFDDPNLRNNYSANRAYGQSKLANLMFTYEIARRLAGTQVTANAVDPGPVATNLFKSEGMASSKSFFLRLGVRIHGLVARPPEQGAQTVIYLASSPEVEGVSGKHWHNKRVTRSSVASRNEADQRRLWDLSQRLTR